MRLLWRILLEGEGQVYLSGIEGWVGAVDVGGDGGAGDDVRDVGNGFLEPRDIVSSILIDFPMSVPILVRSRILLPSMPG